MFSFIIALLLVVALVWEAIYLADTPSYKRYIRSYSHIEIYRRGEGIYIVYMVYKILGFSFKRIYQSLGADKYYESEFSATEKAKALDKELATYKQYIKGLKDEVKVRAIQTIHNVEKVE